MANQGLPKVGDRIKVTGLMANDPDPVPDGTTGTVACVLESSGQIIVKWDIARSLILLETDPYMVIS